MMYLNDHLSLGYVVKSVLLLRMLYLLFTIYGGHPDPAYLLENATISPLRNIEF